MMKLHLFHSVLKGAILLLGTLPAPDSSAQQEVKKVVAAVYTPPLYNLAEPEIISLPPVLNEISGLSYDVATNSVYAVDDEQGNLFRIKLQQEPVVEHWPVSKKMDYEGLAIVDNNVYLLSSPGTIVYFPLVFPVVKTGLAQLPLKGRNEFEILFNDPAGSRLLMMCKSCMGEVKGQVSVYAFQLPVNNFASAPVATLSVSAIERHLGEKIGAFKPSAANVHPLTDDIYIISSVNKLLVVTDNNFVVKEVHRLQPQIFKQPEGLCFSPTGDMLISNESSGKGRATILLFRQRL